MAKKESPRRKRRTVDEQFADIEAWTAAIKTREARKRAENDSGRDAWPAAAGQPPELRPVDSGHLPPPR
jgi:hypothetical protein